jgi:hypothetical protein
VDPAVLAPVAGPLPDPGAHRGVHQVRPEADRSRRAFA